MEFEEELLEFVDTKYPEIYREIRKTKDMSKETELLMQKAITEFKETFNKQR